MQKLEYFGSTSDFYRLGPGVIIKQPKIGWTDPKAEENTDKTRWRDIRFSDNLVIAILY